MGNSAGGTDGADDIYNAISSDAASFKVDIGAEELAELAVGHDFGNEELAAVREVFSYLADKHHDTVIGTRLKLSKLRARCPRPSRASTSPGFRDGMPEH